MNKLDAAPTPDELAKALTESQGFVILYLSQADTLHIVPSAKSHDMMVMSLLFHGAKIWAEAMQGEQDDTVVQRPSAPHLH